MGKATRIKAAEPGEAPTPEQILQGDYVRQFVTHVETQTKTMAHISAHSPVQRWKRDKRLSDSQISAIALCEALWAKTELRQKLTASYGECIPGQFDNEWAQAAKLDADRHLRRIKRTVPPHAWEVWENVVRFGETAGTAGASLGFTGSAGAQAAVLTLCRMVADIIAREERL